MQGDKLNRSAFCLRGNMSSHVRLQRLMGQLLPQQSASVTPNQVSADEYKFVKVGRVGIVTLNRPKALNALSDPLMAEVGRAISTFSEDQSVGCVILTGNGRAFAAGADIKEMKDLTYFQASTKDKIKPWEQISSCKIPIIAAVNGFALGGGCEIAMMCDIIVASSAAKFGQPEINIGTIPGAGGTQRLPRAVGKSKAMELALTGGMITAEEALQYNLVSKVVPPEQLMEVAMKMAKRIASQSRPVVILAKESVNAAYNTTLDQGMRVERRLFHSTFALNDQTVGMNAFANKQRPQFTHT